MLQKSIWLLLMVIFISSCKKEKEDQQVPPPPDGPGNNLRGLNEPGFGKSTESFKDPAWALPAGISLTSNVHWFGFCDADSNWVRKKNYIGVPNPMLEYFLVCMEFRQHTHYTGAKHV